MKIYIGFPKAHILIFILAITTIGCSVGANVTVDAPDVTHPVSQTSSFYTEDNQLMLPGDYRVTEDFSFTMYAMGVNNLIKIRSHKDISKHLNDLVTEHDADGIVDLEISVDIPGINGLFLFLRFSTGVLAVFSTGAAILEPDVNHIVTAVSSTSLFFLMPGVSRIRVDGKLVSIAETNTEFYQDEVDTEFIGE